MSLIQLSEIELRYRTGAVFHDASISIDGGHVHAIVGPNGSGKSMLLRLICGLVRPNSGTIFWDPTIARGKSIRPGSVGALIDRPAYLPLSSGFANLQFLARILRRIDDDRIESVMRDIGLDPSSRKFVRSYSLGMKQKLGIAQAIMEYPDVLVLDEPFNALDTASADYVRGLIRRFAEDGGTVIFTSHNSEDVASLAERVWRLEDGRIHEQR